MRKRPRVSLQRDANEPKPGNAVELTALWRERINVTPVSAPYYLYDTELLGMDTACHISSHCPANFISFRHMHTRCSVVASRKKQCDERVFVLEMSGQTNSVKI